MTIRSAAGCLAAPASRSPARPWDVTATEIGGGGGMHTVGYDGSQSLAGRGAAGGDWEGRPLRSQTRDKIGYHACARSLVEGRGWAESAGSTASPSQVVHACGASQLTPRCANTTSVWR